MRIYTDLDNVLINPVQDVVTGEVLSIVPRPDADWFLESLANQGEVWLLTMANRAHANRALQLIGTEHLSGIVSAEDMVHVIRLLEMILKADGLSDEDRRQLVSEIPKVGPPGMVFDDYPVGSDMQIVKSAAIGIGPESWIEVEPFVTGVPDRKGLRKAFQEFQRRRKVNTSMGSPNNKVPDVQLRYLDQLNEEMLERISADPSMPESMKMMVFLHLKKPWIAHYLSLAIAPLKEGLEDYLADPVFEYKGKEFYFPSDRWWKSHGERSHEPMGEGCIKELHVEYLTKGGKSAEFDYAAVLRDGSVRILTAQDFDEECRFWDVAMARVMR